jgi:NRPS condensation-like uncharacterized protein
MTKINNYISQILFNEKKGSYGILTYIDFDRIFDTDILLGIVNKVIKKNPILTQRIIDEKNKFYLEENSDFKITEHYDIHYTQFKKFNQLIHKQLNKEFDIWYVLFCVDEKKCKTRMYFKIDHAYADGYKLIQMLISPFQQTPEPENLTSKFKRSSPGILSSIYYYLIGTLTVLILNIRFLYKVLCSPKIHTDNFYENARTDYILFTKMDFKQVKEFTVRNGITVNDFMYALMIRTQYNYTRTTKQIYSASPINISKTSDTNNICPLFLSATNHHDNKTLLKNINHMFNCCKYSLFVPLLSYFIPKIIPFFNKQTILGLYSSISNECDFTFSNIIGPDCKSIGEFKIKDVHFLTNTKSNQTCFNIISYEDGINLIVSFREGLIDKNRFKKCVWEAYKNLIAT